MYLRDRLSAPRGRSAIPASHPAGVMFRARSAVGELRLTIRAGGALTIMSARYWPTVAPLVREELRRWKQQARAIPDPFLRALALQKLHEESFNVAMAPTFATLAPRARRTHVVQAIVALQIIYDFLDGLTEQPVPDPLRNGQRLFEAFTDAVSPDSEPDRDYYRENPRSQDGGYLEELVAAVRSALAELAPGADAIVAVAQIAAARVAGAQVRAHAVSQEGTAQLEEWAAREAAGTGLQWREFLAGAASSVIAVHALIAAAADRRTTPQQGARIDTAYISICAMATMLDSLIDHDGDLGGRELQLGYMRYYPDRAILARELSTTARHAASKARTLPNAGHHLMTLVGVVAYYTSAPEANGEFARPLTANIRRELGPLIAPTLAFLRAWRLARRLRLRWHGDSPEHGRTNHESAARRR